MGVPAQRWSTRADLLRQLELAKRWLDEAPLSEVSVYMAARHAGLSIHHFIRLFGESYGTTPHRYITSRRVDLAKTLLVDTRMTVGEIAAEVGFGNQSAFSRLFRACTGMTPIQFRAGSKS